MNNHTSNPGKPILLIAVLAVMLAGCVTPQPAAQNPGGFAPWSEAGNRIPLAPGDEIEVKLTYTPELNERVFIGPDGYISLPVAGSVRAAGLTTDGLTELLAERYSRDLREPEVMVIQRGFGSQRIMVGGEVEEPGAVDITGRIGVLEAVTLAGGLKDTARTKEIAILRRGADGKPMLRLFNLNAYLSGQDSADVPLRGSDVVFVPRSSVAELNLFIDQYIRQNIPFERSFAYTIEH